MAKLALVVAIVALAVSILAYQAAGGGRALDANLRAVERTVGDARQWTIDTFTRLARALRGGPNEAPPPRSPQPPKRQ